MPRDAFALWGISFFDVEKRLACRLQQNVHFPFQVQQPNGTKGNRLPPCSHWALSGAAPGPSPECVYVMEYYKDTLWKGAVIFLLSVLGVVLYCKYGKTSQDYSGLFAYGMLVGLWLFLSSMYKRHLVINHNRGCYQIYIKRQLWQEGPLYQIYIRLAAQMDAYGKPFYRLILNGYGLEVLALASLSDKYEQMEFLGKQIAHKLRLNYFDWPDVSARHVIRHWPLPLEDGGLEV